MQDGIVVDGVAAVTRYAGLWFNEKAPPMQPFFGAGLAFSKCHAFQNVPYDPYMSYLFKGEEFNRAARLFTHGYDMYPPTYAYAFHHYDDDPMPHGFENTPKRSRGFLTGSSSKAEDRWRRIFGMDLHHAPLMIDDDLETFGLGHRRTLDEFLKFAGIDLVKETVTDFCDKAYKIKWVPYHYEDSKENPFRPSGPSCPSRMSHKCCTNLQRSRLKSQPWLSLTNDHIEEMLRHPPRRPDPLAAGNDPIYDSGDAPFGPCQH